MVAQRPKRIGSRFALHGVRHRLGYDHRGRGQASGQIKAQPAGFVVGQPAQDWDVFFDSGWRVCWYKIFFLLNLSLRLKGKDVVPILFHTDYGPVPFWRHLQRLLAAGIIGVLAISVVMVH